MKLLFNLIKVIFKIYSIIFKNKYLKKYSDYLYLRYYGVETKLGYVLLEGLPIITKHKTGIIIIGPGTHLISHSKYNSAGINHPVILNAGPNSLLHIHGPFGASGSAIVAMSSVIIESGVALGANSHVYDTDFHPIGLIKNEKVKVKSVRICQNVWIAANCLVLKGVTIGMNTVVGACSLINKDLESNSIYAGIPAKKIKDLK